MHKTFKSLAVAAGLASLVGCHHGVAGVSGDSSDEDGGLPSVVLRPTFHVDTCLDCDVEEPKSPTTSFTGEALYCLRMDTPLGDGLGMGSEHFGVFVDLAVSDSDGLDAIGIRFDSGRERYVMGSLGGTLSAQYLAVRRNLPAPHGLDPVIFAKDSLRNESTVAMSEVDCQTLDALMGW